MTSAAQQATDPHTTTLRAGTARAYRIAAGGTIRITNTHGAQVVDAWALSADSPDEHLSMEHTRAVLQQLSPKAGDELYSNRRRPLLELTNDSSPGVHDTLIAACDAARYQRLGYDGFHRNCTENFYEAIADLNIRSDVPAPFNLFMNIPVASDGSLSFEPSTCRPGDGVTLTTLHDVYVILSACPQDLVPINGNRYAPADVAVAVNPAMP